MTRQLFPLRSFLTWGGLFIMTAQLVKAQEELPLPVEGSVELNTQVDINLSDTSEGIEDGVETLTRGPLHEAFAEPLISDPKAGLIVKAKPPEDITEVTPEFRPEGDEAIWISGYWGWDEQRQDFIWISGVYRVPPEGLRWIPGYWHDTGDGWQWVPGLWVEQSIENLEYVPAPPATLELGPSSPAPNSDHFYVPGYWSQQSSGYLWNVGYWHPLNEDFVWVPAHYIWTPRGCIFVDGYWDRRLPMRGFCFAPVVVQHATYSRPGWRLRPTVVLDSHVILHNLFIQPGYSHYLFGDYYDIPSFRHPIVPAYVYHQRYGSCDPLISFYTAYNARHGHDLIGWYGNWHSQLRRSPEKRPPHVWNPKQPRQVAQAEPMAYTLEQIGKGKAGPKLIPVLSSTQQEMLQRTQQHKQILQDRQSLERIKAGGRAPGGIGSLGPSLQLPPSVRPNPEPGQTVGVAKVPSPPKHVRRDDHSLRDPVTILQNELNKQRNNGNKIETPRVDRGAIDRVPSDRNATARGTIDRGTLERQTLDRQSLERVLSQGGIPSKDMTNRIDRNANTDRNSNADRNRQNQTVPPTKAGSMSRDPMPPSTRREIPQLNAPRVNTPRIDIPRIDAPRTDAPRFDAPRYDAPRQSDSNRRIEIPRSQAPILQNPPNIRTLPSAPAQSGLSGFSRGQSVNPPSVRQPNPGQGGGKQDKSNPASDPSRGNRGGRGKGS